MDQIFCFVSSSGNDNTNDNPDIIFPIRDTKLYVPVITLSAKDNQKLSKLFSQNKDLTNKYSYFLESKLLESIDYLFCFIKIKMLILKDFKTQPYHLPKGFIDNYNVINNTKNFYNQPNDSDIKRYEEIRKLTTGNGEDYTTGCLLDYDYIKNHYRLIAVDLSRQKELDADTKAIQQTEFVGQLKN